MSEILSYQRPSNHEPRNGVLQKFWYVFSRLKRTTRLALLSLILLLLAVPVINRVQLELRQQAAGRNVVDRADQVSGNQVQVIYVLPSDGVDRQLDTDGTLERSVNAFQQWFEKESGGRRLRIDTFNGKLDIVFVRLNRTDADIAQSGAYVRDELESELATLGFNKQDKIYAVYYEGGSTYACGGGAWPPTKPGKVAALYLHGTPPNASRCDANSFASTESAPGYLEFAMLHELLHTLGAVAICAPHHTLSGHVSEDPTDLMYAGNLPWQPSKLDIGRDDYFGHINTSCFDLAKSTYLTENTLPTVTIVPTQQQTNNGGQQNTGSDNNGGSNNTGRKKGDVNGDGIVNSIDLSKILLRWNQVDASVDQNGDGRVNIIDLSILLTNWGK